MKPVDILLESKALTANQLYVPNPRTLEESFKPRGPYMWTSTAYKTENGKYSSSWVRWCKSEMPKSLSDVGVLYKILPGANILSLDTNEDVKNLRDSIKIEIDIYSPSEQFWQEVSKTYDAINHTPIGGRLSNTLLYRWDAESTVWFNKTYLQKIDLVPIDL